MKKFILFLCFALLLSGKSLAVSVPDIQAEACVLMEPDSGRFLYEKNADSHMLIASTTKILTALVVLENCPISDTVTIEKQWTEIEGSSMYLQSGESYTVYELLVGMMLSSGNDAAVSLACYTAESEDEFALLMNEKAVDLGCTNSHFTNASGLDGDRHYSSAHDMALIASAAVKNDTLREIFSSTTLSVHGQNLYNHNKLLTRCVGCFGVKTGYTMAAGRTLVSCCQREGMTLICVTLSDPDDWNDHIELYDWAYEHWHLTEVFPEIDEVLLANGAEESLSVCSAKSIYLPLSDEDKVHFTYELPRFIYAPIDSGDTVGSGTIWVNDEALFDFPIISKNEITPIDSNEQHKLFSFLNNLGRKNNIF